MKKLIIILIAILAFTISCYSQSNIIDKKAEKYVEKMNNYITSVNKDLALSNEQRVKILEIQKLRIVAHDKIKEQENNLAKRRELNKPINKKYGRMINVDVLSKEQYEAFKKGKKLSKSK